ncbi:hypothetical protein ASPWEDRAFT_171311 [Aspergillus wentii DTO 134E9]|uniref:Uncharacterized protein n=1 Tax=Aspergillus wentii DTO 134E9 TaxID=1073089 RepID=A0A1L9RSG1_ASPWE|nr:uncharacterized protein ASPWEDRAFT_171311 [Aspergillus wentii DTO 134E9]KAI9930687.1 hypothetical protein MW887_011442 [Aspergillus wentii]OJJ37849.1 hypothetical protein ASPWEDRAFT_171311 [Aspergillus wentii DTO 134E9]
METLPAELLVSIYQAFDDLDDALRLRRSCQHLWQIFDIPENRHAIIKEILKQFDRSHLINSEIEPTVHMLHDEILLPAQTIPDIACRWHTMKIVADYSGSSRDWEIMDFLATLKHELDGADIGEALICAAKEGLDPVVELLLRKGADIEEQPDSFGSALSWAANFGRKRIVQRLLNHGANVEYKNTNGETALFYAVEGSGGQESETIIDMLLERGARVDNTDRNGRTVLACAISCGREDRFVMILEWCVRNGRRDVVNLTDNDGHSLLHLVAQTDCAVSLIERLIAEGADIGAMDRANESPLMEALSNRDPTLSGDEVVERIKLLSQREGILLTPTTEGKVSLHYAARHRDPKVIFYLLENGARDSVNLADRDGMTPLMEALTCANEDVAEKLLELPEIELNQSTVLQLAAEHCTPRLISSLLKEKAMPIDSIDDQGRTPLFAAFETENLENFKYLLQQGADITITSPSIQDPLRYAAEGNIMMPF